MHTLGMIIFQTFRLSLLRRLESSVPSPIKTMRLTSFGLDNPRMLCHVFVKGGGTTLLRPQYQEGGMSSLSSIESSIDTTSCLCDNFAGREGDTLDGTVLCLSCSEEGGMDIVQYEMYTIVGVTGVGGSMLCPVVHFEYMPRSAIDSFHGRYGRSTSE